MSAPRLPPLHVLTGFLGSGKSTLLNHLVQQPQLACTAVLINELGAAAIDHLLVERIDEEIVVLGSGCICCTLRDDLTASLEHLWQRRADGDIAPFHRVVLETTGIADPAAIVQMLMGDKFFCRTFRVGQVVTVVDALLCGAQLEAHGETARQIATADCVVLSKCDLAGSAARAHAREAVAGINGMAKVLESPGPQVAALADLLDADGEASPGAAHRPRPRPAGDFRHDGPYRTIHLWWDEAVEWKDLEDWLSSLLFARGEDIVRLKGIAHVAGEQHPIVVQGVRHSLFAPARLARWPAGRPRTDMVLITRHFSAAAARRSLLPFCKVNAHTA